MKTIIFPDGVALLDETKKEVTFRNTISKLPQNSSPGLGDIVIIDGRSGIVTEYNPAIYGNVSGKVTQTIKPHDFAYMVEMSGIHGGSTVLESGVGSGQLTAALLWAVGTGGSVVSVDISERNLQIARENLSLHHDISNWRPVLADIGNFSSDILFDSVFLVYYLEHGLNFSYAAASYSGSIFLVFGFVGGILGGLTINKFRSVKSFFVASISITSFLMISISFFHNLIVIYLISAVLGMFTVQGFSAIYVLVSRSMSHRSQTTSSLSVVNAAQEVPGSIWPYVFTLLVAGVGYGRSWDILGLVSFGMMFIILIPFSARKRDPEMNDTHMR